MTDCQADIDLKKLIGKKVKSLRENMELSYAQLETKTGIGASRLKSIEKGKGGQAIDIYSLSQFFKINIYDLFDKNGTNITNERISDNIFSPKLLPENTFRSDVECLTRIYEYNDINIINAIHQNLITFVRTIDREKEVTGLKSILSEHESRMKILEDKLSAIGREKEDKKITRKMGVT